MTHDMAGFCKTTMRTNVAAKLIVLSFSFAFDVKVFSAKKILSFNSKIITERSSNFYEKCRTARRE